MLRRGRPSARMSSEDAFGVMNLLRCWRDEGCDDACDDGMIRYKLQTPASFVGARMR